MGGGGWDRTPYREPAQPKPGSKERPQTEIFPDKGPTQFPPTKDELLLANYKDIRFNIHEVEEIIASIEADGEFDDIWSEHDLKRLDKAVIVMKTGAKMLKKMLKKRGVLNTKVLMDAG